MWDAFQIGLWDVVRDVVQILILAMLLYYVIRLVRGTRSAQMLLGLAVVVLTLIGLSILFSLDVLSWLLGAVSVYVAVSLVVIFQPEIRHALAVLGGGSLLGSGTTPAGGTPQQVAEHLVAVVTRLARRRHGALIAIERDIALKDFQESGVPLDAPIVPELLQTIFFPHTPLHDGGVVLRGDRILAARCVFPLTQRPDLEELGTRHRAALGLSEETDAVVLVVSEETGMISVAHEGRLYRDLGEEKLRRYLAALLPERGVRDIAWRRALENFVLGDDRRVPEAADEGEGRDAR